MSKTQLKRLRQLVAAMRKEASAKGPNHSWWDTIFDIEAFIAGGPTVLKQSADEWIAHAERLLQPIAQTQAAVASGFNPDDDPDLLENIDRFNRI